MTPSEKPERSGSQSAEDANPTSVITQANDDGDSSASSERPGTSSGAEDDADALDGTEVPPPWQRTSNAPSTGEDSGDQGEQEQAPSEAQASTAVHEQDTVRTEMPAQQPQADATRSDSVGSERGGSERAAFGTSSARTGSSSSVGTSSRRPSRGPRRASLQVKRVDPWSVLKLALVLSVAMFFVWMIAVAVLYGVLDGMGVWDQLNGTFTELTQSDNTATEALISAGRVFSVASIIGGINIVLVTALATVAAFIYNVAADFAGGVELTLSERE